MTGYDTQYCFASLDMPLCADISHVDTNAPSFSFHIMITNFRSQKAKSNHQDKFEETNAYGEYETWSRIN